MVILAGLLLLLPWLPEWPFTSRLLPAYRVYTATMFGVWLLIMMSINLLTGYSGQTSLGQGALVLGGAYTTAILRQQMAVPLPLALLLTGVITGAVGAILIGLPATRLRGPYLGIATFALAIALPQLLKINLFTTWTGGVRGIRLAPLVLPPSIAPLLDTPQWRYYTVLAFAAPLLLVFINLIRSHWGRAFVALREDELVAGQMGIKIRRHKLWAFGLSAGIAGIGGGLLFVVQGYVSPDSLGIFDSILILVAIVIGGLGSCAGSLYGALFLTFQSELISSLTRAVPQAEKLGTLFFGLLLIGGVLFFPHGVAGAIDRLKAWLRQTIS